MKKTPDIDDVQEPDEPKQNKLSKAEIDKLVNDNTNLAYYFANHWHIAGADREDIEQQAMAGLVKAANTYNPSLGKFSSYASRVIQNYLGSLNFKTGIQTANVKTSLQAPVAGDEGDDATLGDFIGNDDDSIRNGRARDEATALINAEVDKIREPNRSMVRRWMNGESYRDMQKDFGISFMMICYIVRDELNKLKKRLADRGVVNFQDIWPESLDIEDNGKVIFECIVSTVIASLALDRLQEGVDVKKRFSRQ